MAAGPVTPVVPPLTPQPPLGGAALRRGTTQTDRARTAARQFEAVFMTEMLRQTRQQSPQHGRFAPGEAEKSWQVFMDQALGEAAVPPRGSALTRQIERAMGVPDAKRPTPIR